MPDVIDLSERRRLQIANHPNVQRRSEALEFSGSELARVFERLADQAEQKKDQ